MIKKALKSLNDIGNKKRALFKNIASKYSNKIINTGNPVRKRFSDIAKKPEDFNVIENFCILLLNLKNTNVTIDIIMKNAI